jgi:hypothetical protein
MDTGEFKNVRWTEYCEADDGFVYGKGERNVPYVASGDDDLAAHLARIGGSGGDRLSQGVPALLRFYRSFGFLGRMENRMYEYVGRSRLHSSEQITWALQHASNVGLILGLHRARRAELDRYLGGLATRGRVRVKADYRTGILDGKLAVLERERSLLHSGNQATATKALGQISDRIEKIQKERRSLIDDTADTQHAKGVMIPLTRAPWQRPLSIDLTAELRERDPLRVSRQVIAELLDPNLAGVDRVYDPFTGAPKFRFETLLDVMYWQLADALGAYRLRRCPCGALFFAYDQRQKHCPPDPGQRESRCTVRFRMRRKRRG